jgi:amidase
MAVQKMTPRQLIDVADEVGLSLTDDDISSFLRILDGWIEPYNVVDRLPDFLPEVKYPRTPGYRPSSEENRHNAWYVKTTIKGAAEGKLKGKTVAVKDNVLVAGVPMMNGAATLEGYIPDVDAEVVTRLLDAGATILGKAHCEGFCCSGASHTNATGPVHNPYKMGYSAGGSSSGSATLVSLGEVDMAVGGDQGGSIRMPASFSGIYGMKPTHGLVPYTGIMGIESYIDHTGPMTRSVRDNALMLEVMAGSDGIDTRQINVVTHPYLEMLGSGVKGLKIGVVKEGFGQVKSDADVDAANHNAAKHFAKMGAIVEEISIPWHTLALAIYTPICMEGGAQTLLWGDGYGTKGQDLYVTSLMDFHRGWRARADQLPETTKLAALIGTHMRNTYGTRYYGKAMNLSRQLRAAYDRALEKYDLLLMPTTPMKATKIPEPTASREEYVERALEVIVNTCPFNMTHHPAMAIPCGMSDGLPLSMMLIGRHFEEPTIYRAAYAFEQAEDWKTL